MSKSMVEEELKKIDEQVNKLLDEMKKLEKKKEELLVKAGQGYYCRKCGKFVEIGDLDRDRPYVKEKLCYWCWEKVRIDRSRERWLKLIGDAKVVDVEPHSIYDDALRSIVLEKGEKKYKLQVGGWNEPYIEILDLETNTVVSVKDEE